MKLTSVKWFDDNVLLHGTTMALDIVDFSLDSRVTAIAQSVPRFLLHV